LVGSGIFSRKVLVSHQHRFIFVKTRKTGGSSVQIALAQYMDHPDDVVVPVVGSAEDGTPRLNNGVGKNARIPVWRWRIKDFYWVATGFPREYKEHMGARFIRRYVGRSVWDDYYTFAVERNPWDRLVSRYFYHFRPERGRSQIAFNDFVESDILPAWSNWHLYTHKDQVIVDKLIRYDSLEDELREVTDLLGIPRLELPRAKGQYRKDRRPYQEWYNDSTRQRIAEVFSREIEYFGWTFD